MDSLTQIVLGGAVAEFVAGKKMGNKAILWGAIAGTIPDLDVFFRAFYEPIDAALIHRGFSHSILFSLLASPLLAYLFTKIYRGKHEFNVWLKLFFFSIITHPMLDMFTNYGTQFLWPLDTRISFNTIFVIDPLYTFPFLGCLIAVLFYQRESPKRRRINNIGIIYSSSYLLLGVIIKLFIYFNVKNQYESNGYQVERIMVTPMPFTSLYWYALLEDDANFYVNYKSVFAPIELSETDTISKSIRLDDLNWKDPDMSEKLSLISNNYYSIVFKENLYLFYDLRFGMSGKLTAEQINEPVMCYKLEKENNQIISAKSDRNRKVFSKVDFHYYWKKIWGN